MALLSWFGRALAKTEITKTLPPLKQQVSDKDIETALHSVAQLVHVYGDKYWPIFERLEEEIEKRRSMSKRLIQVLRPGCNSK